MMEHQMREKHEAINEAAWDKLRESALSHLVKALGADSPLDFSSTRILIVWASGGMPAVVEGPEAMLPTLVLERVQEEIKRV